MIIFWFSYGLWTAFLFSGVVWLGTIAVNRFIIWITNGDYDLSKNKIYNIIVCNVKPQIVGYIISLQIFFWTTLMVLFEDDTYHTIAVNIAEFVTTYLSQPLLIMLSVVGLALLVKKVYPLFKKIKTLLDNDNQ